MFRVDTLQQSLRLVANEFRSGLLVDRSVPGQPAFEWQPLPEIAQISPGYGIAVADFNGDGRTDAAIAQNNFTREPETGLWRGGLGQLLCQKRGHSTFSSDKVALPDQRNGKSRMSPFLPVPPQESGLVVPGDAKGAASLDLNGDARPDLLIAQNDDVPVVLRNQEAGAWLALRLTFANGIPAIGARVTAHFADGTMCAGELYAGSGYLSQSAPEIYFGLRSTAPERAEIRWPKGEVQTVDLQGKSGRITLTNPGTSGPQVPAPSK
jgi:hypothetical protein